MYLSAANTLPPTHPATLSGKYLGECIFCDAQYFLPVQGGGFDKALATLANPLKDKIRLNHVVTKIEYTSSATSNEPAQVTYIDAKKGTVHTKLARRVLITVPLGVLKAKTIEFVPSLPKWKQDAIDYIGFGVLDKCIFYWENEGEFSWWPNGKEYMTLVTDQDDSTGVWTTFFNDRELGNRKHFVLSAWIGGDKALAVEKLSDQVIVAQVLSNLRAMLGKDVPEPAKYVISRWGQDAFARGSYSFYNVGEPDSVDSARERLRNPIGMQLFWAGEATSTSGSYGTTFGALSSGVKAAKSIRKSLARRATY
jgi:monoamine oxidase